jgi:hypothetical protein
MTTYDLTFEQRPLFWGSQGWPLQTDLTVVPNGHGLGRKHNAVEKEHYGEH